MNDDNSEIVKKPSPDNLEIVTMTMDEWRGFDISWAAWSGSPVACPAHQCNCIGCCRKCGMCMTHPRHSLSACRQIAELNRQKAAIINGTVGLMPRISGGLSEPSDI